MQVSAGFLGWLASLFPEYEAPDWLTNPSGAFATLYQTIDGLGYWVDFVALGAIVGTVCTLYAVAFGIKLVRAIIAHVPAVGGAG